MNRTELLKSVAEKRPTSFIGYGNPNSNILVIGKECAFDSEKNDKRFIEITYEGNATSWMKFCCNPFESNSIKDWTSVPPIPEEWEKDFSPRFAFRGQKYALKKDSGTTRTWYMYQTLLDLYRGISREHDEILDFQDYCFITELNGLPMKMSHPSSDVQKSIMDRVNGLFTEPFIKSFPVVIAACKGYVHRYHVDLQSMFPQSKIIVTNQLSMMPRKGYLEDIVDMMKGDAPYIEV